MATNTFETQGVRVAVEGCVSRKSYNLLIFTKKAQGHGTLDAIYASVEESCKQRGWDGVDILIIGGDFQVFEPLHAYIIGSLGLTCTDTVCPQC